MTDITDLIGCERDHSGVKGLLTSLGTCTETDTFGVFEISDYPEHGICLYFDQEGVLVTAFLYGQGHEEHSQYRGALPNGTSFGDSRSEVRRKLGAPERSGPNWERFGFAKYFLHFEFSSAGEMRMITIMVPWLEDVTAQ